MGVIDLLFMALILTGCGWLLWHFLWKKQGSCHGCDHKHGKTDNDRR